MRRTDTTHKRQTGPLRRVVSTNESGYYVVFTLECGHNSLMRPYKFKEHKPYPVRRRCFASCQTVDFPAPADTTSEKEAR